MSDRLTVALAQVMGSERIEENVKTMENLALKAADEGAGLLVLPEMFMAKPTKERSPARLAEEDGGRFLEEMKRIAARAGIHITAGAWEASDDPRRPYNALHTVSPEGELKGSYRKLHLFDALSIRESDSMSPGKEKPPVLKIGPVRVGFAICYDLRFPELFRSLSEGGADLVVVASAWYQGPLKEDHWLTLLRARAVENTCYVAGCNLTGSAFCGRSSVFDPFGVPMSGAGEEETLILGRIDPGRIEEVRGKLPCLGHRRRELF